MTKENNIALYSGDTLSIRIGKYDDPTMKLENLKIRGIYYDIILAELPDGTKVDIFINQEID